MVTEIAQLEIKLGSEAAFEAAVAKIADLPRSRGFNGLELHRSVEKPQRYRILAKWDSVADHDAFRASPLFAEYRALVGPRFAATPEMEHTETVVTVSF